jgi:hypothetical protein
VLLYGKASEILNCHFTPYRQIFFTVENKKLFDEITDYKNQKQHKKFNSLGLRLWRIRESNFIFLIVTTTQSCGSHEVLLEILT